MIAGILLVVAVAVPWTSACGGYYLQITKLSPCKNVDSVITFEEFNSTLGTDCKVTPSGCLNIAKGFTVSAVNYDILKDGVTPYQGEQDGCKSVASSPDEAVVILKLFGLPTSCPVTAGKACGGDGKSVDVSPYKSYFLAAAGKYSGKVFMKHDTGDSCFKFNCELKSRGFAG